MSVMLQRIAHDIAGMRTIWRKCGVQGRVGEGRRWRQRRTISRTVSLQFSRLSTAQGTCTPHAHPVNDAGGVLCRPYPRF